MYSGIIESNLGIGNPKFSQSTAKKNLISNIRISTAYSSFSCNYTRTELKTNKILLYKYCLRNFLVRVKFFFLSSEEVKQKRNQTERLYVPHIRKETSEIYNEIQGGIMKYFLIILVVTFVSNTLPLSAENDLTNYIKTDKNKKHEIVFEIDRSFKSEELTFFDFNREIAVAPDGKIYVSCTREHSILSINEQGGELKKFGKKGKGPGDLYFPHRLTFLDGAYLVIGEKATNRRISLFDQNGKFVKVIRTKRAAYSPIALKNKKIAYLSSKDNGSGNITEENWLVIIKDIETGQEEIIQEITVVNKGKIILPNKALYSVGNYVGKVYITRGYNENLIIGYSKEKTLHIYDPVNKSKKTIELNHKPIPVTGEYLKAFKQTYLTNLAKNFPANHPAFKLINKRLEDSSFKEFFADHLPYYSDMIATSSGEIILVQRYDLKDKKELPAIFISAKAIEQMPVTFKIRGCAWPPNGKFRHIVLKGDMGYILVKNTDNSDETYQLRRIKPIN